MGYEVLLHVDIIYVFSTVYKYVTILERQENCVDHAEKYLH